MPALCARAGMDFSKIGVIYTNNRPKISPLCEDWHRFLRKFGNFGEKFARRAGLKNYQGRSQPSAGSRLLAFVFNLFRRYIWNWNQDLWWKQNLLLCLGPDWPHEGILLQHQVSSLCWSPNWLQGSFPVWIKIRSLELAPHSGIPWLCLGWSHGGVLLEFLYHTTKT